MYNVSEGHSGSENEVGTSLSRSSYSVISVGVGVGQPETEVRVLSDRWYLG